MKAGANIILVFCKNDNGESERARKYLYTGYDQPMAISNIALTYDGYEAKLTWQAPTATTHNGYLDTKSLTYNVVRYPQGDTVATGLKNTSFTETLPSDTLQHYHYTVTAVNYVTESDPTESNSVLIGKPFELPYTDDFESGNLNNYSTIDPSKSGYDWEVTTDYDNEDAGNVLLYSNYYCYDTANNWIVLPPINLKADNVTMLTFKAHTGDWDNSLNEKLNVMIGRNEDTKLFKKVQSFTVSSYNFSTFTVPVIVSEDGTYRIALQCVSDASSYGIYIDDLSVTAGPGTTAPAAVTELTVTPADKGEMKATVSFKTPDKSIAGESLSSLSKVELLREDGTVAGSISNPNPAKIYSIVDNAALSNGINTYSVVAYNAEGKAGLEAKASAYVGIDVPLAPTNTSVAYTLDGTAQISWNDPGSIGINSGYVDTKALTYNVYSVDSDGYLGDTLKSNLASNTCTLNIDQEGEQGTVYYGITAKSAGGEGSAATAGPVISGKSYELPFVESFPDGDKTNFWYYTADEDIYLGLTKRMSADDDNGAFYAYSYGDNPETFTFYSGKINLNGATNPVLTFMYYARPGADASIKIGINENGQTTDTISTVIDYSKLTGKEGWRVCYVPLDAKYANDKYIALQFIGTVTQPSNYKDWYDLATIIIDRIAVRDAKANDLEASITAPSKLLAQANADIKVSVSNIGRNTADGYDVTLYVNGKEWKTLKGPKLEPGELGKVGFTYPYNVGDPEENEVYAVVNYTVDEDMSNNTTNKATFAVQHTTMPTIKDLTATTDGKTTNLHWTVPETSGSSATENFESYDDGTIDNMGLWTLINCDNDGSMSVYPGDWKHSNEPKSWMVADAANNGAAFQAHSGEKLIISFPSYPETADWLISPLLNGEAQTISFWALTLGSVEQLSYYTSSTDTCINSFTKIKDLPIANTEWQKYSFDVPQGTRYFAIVHSYSSLACMIDDISFIQGAPEIKYFKIYRDRTNVGQSDNTGYADVADESGVHTYNVTTVYNYGESDFSNDATVTVTGINNIEADNGESSEYYDVQGRRIAQPAHGVTIVRSSTGKVMKTVKK